MTATPPSPTRQESPPGGGAAPPPTSGGAEFVRIGIAGGRSRADLAVPAGLPLARLMPSLLEHAGEEPDVEGGVRHAGWMVCRIDGTRLDPAMSLAAQSVRDGDLLFVRHGDAKAAEPLYDDVVEVITEGRSGAPWAAGATRSVAAVLATVAVLAACAALAAAPGRLPGALGLGVGGLALGVGVLMSRAFGDIRAGTVAAVLAAPPMVTGAVLLLGGDEWGAAHVLLGCVVLAVTGALGPLLIGGGDGTFTALVTTGVLATIGALICAVWGTTPARAASVAGPFALALTTAIPTIALRIARAPAPYVAGSAEDLEELPSQLEHGTLTARIQRARQLLLGMVAGCHLVTGGAVVVLLADGQMWPGIVGGTLIVLMLLRSRLFKDTVQTVIPIVTAVLAAGGAVTFLVLSLHGATVQLLGVLLPVAALVALISGLVGLFAGRRKMNPRVSRTLDIIEVIILLTVIPFVLAVWGVYGALLNLDVFQ